MTTQQIIDSVVEKIAQRGLSLTEIIISDTKATAKTEEGVTVKFKIDEL